MEQAILTIARAVVSGQMSCLEVGRKINQAIKQLSITQTITRS